MKKLTFEQFRDIYNNSASCRDLFNTLLPYLADEQPVEQPIIPFIVWLAKQGVLISEGVDGSYFKSNVIGGRKYTPEELYELYKQSRL